MRVLDRAEPMRRRLPGGSVERLQTVRELLATKTRQEIAQHLGITSCRVGQIIRQNHLTAAPVEARPQPEPPRVWLANEKRRGDSARELYRAERAKRQARTA